MTSTNASGTTTVQSTEYPTTGSSFGALKYNLNPL